MTLIIAAIIIWIFGAFIRYANKYSRIRYVIVLNPNENSSRKRGFGKRA